MKYTVTIANEDGEVLERIEIASSMLDELRNELSTFEYDPIIDGE
jgi:hypothetical protein